MQPIEHLSPSITLYIAAQHKMCESIAKQYYPFFANFLKSNQTFFEKPFDTTVQNQVAQEMTRYRAEFLINYTKELAKHIDQVCYTEKTAIDALTLFLKAKTERP